MSKHKKDRLLNNYFSFTNLEGRVFLASAVLRLIRHTARWQIVIHYFIESVSTDLRLVSNCLGVETQLMKPLLKSLCIEVASSSSLDLDS